MTSTPDDTSVTSTFPPGSRFDPITGAQLGAGPGAGAERRESFALQPGEPVLSFNLVTSLLPMASGTAPQTYRWALAVGVVLPVLAGALGYLAFAFVAAAIVVPAIYIVYMYDVNQWEDQPVPVVLGAVGLAATLGVGFTFLWHGGLLGGSFASANLGEGAASIRWSSLLVLCLLVPVVSELFKQVGPLLLASRPKFDDMIDGLTFGVAAGAAYAAAETIVVNRALFGSFGSVDNPNAGFWVSLILSAAIVKPIVYGAATGIAVAAYSGIGAGYDGFKPGYLRGLGEALAANILFQLGLFMAARLDGTTGAIVGLLWGALIAVVLVVRLRYMLHFAVLESALESVSHGTDQKDSAQGTAWCPSCDMPLVHGANFCVVCGTATRAGSKVTRRRNRSVDTVADAPGGIPVSAVAAPRDNRQTAVVVAAVVATIAAFGVVGQVVSSTAEKPGTSPTSPIKITPDLSGPQTDANPAPAPVPGPAPDDASTAPSAYRASSSVPGVSLAAASRLAPAVGQPVQVGGGISVTLADGWELHQQGNGFVQAGKDGAYFVVQLSNPPAEVSGMVTSLFKMLQGAGVQNLEATQPQNEALPSSALVAAASLQYRGVLASQQGGTNPIEGFAYCFVRQDGTGITAFGLFPKDAVQTSQTLVADYNAMLSSLVNNLSSASAPAPAPAPSSSDNGGGF